MKDCLLSTTVRWLAGASVRWLGCEPIERQRIYFANHTSNLDALVLWTALPDALRRITRPVAAHDYWTATRLRKYIAENIFKAVLIERTKVTRKNNPIALMTAALQQKASLILFPEGGRCAGPEIGPFKGGLYHLACECPDVELVPVHIDNMNRILPKGEVLPVPLLSCISFGAPLHLQSGEPKPEFLRRARFAVEQLHDL